MVPRIHKSDLEDNIPELIRERIPKAKVETVFDVGANVGWVTVQFLKAYQDCRVWSFEPIESTYEGLRKNMGLFDPQGRAKTERIGLSSSVRKLTMTDQRDVTVNRVLKPEESSDQPTVVVDFDTGDNYCVRVGINHIDFLKIDAEGHDMHVLIGFGKLIASGAIDFIQVEAGIAADNNLHIPLWHFAGFLAPFGYHILWIKNQASNQIPYLQWADVVFIHKSAAELYA